MLDHEPDTQNPDEPTPLFTDPTPEPAVTKPPRRRRAATRPAGPPAPTPTLDIDDQAKTSSGNTAEAAADASPEATEPAKRTAKKTTRRRTAKKTTASEESVETTEPAADEPKTTTRRKTKKSAATPDEEPKPARKRATKKATTRKAAAKSKTPAADAPVEAGRAEDTPAEDAPIEGVAVDQAAEVSATEAERVTAEATDEPATADAPATDEARATDDAAAPAQAAAESAKESPAAEESADPIAQAVAALLGPAEGDGQQPDDDTDAEKGDTSEKTDASDEDVLEGHRRRRRRRGGRRRRRGGGPDGDDSESGSDADETASETEDTDSRRSKKSGDDTDGSDGSDGESEGSGRRRRRRRRRGDDSGDDSGSRSRRDSKSEVTGIDGSTRMEAKRQRRREGREAGRRRAPILSEAEFLSRRESVSRKMVIRQREDLTQIAVLEDDILVEHYVDRDSAASLIGNVYLGRVQNVLPSMEAAFIDIGRGRNAVLYAGEVDWDSFGVTGEDRKVEKVLKSGQTVLVQVSKDPVGAKGARLTNHVTIPGRYIVYAPGGHLSGISRKLPDTERKRLKDILGDLVPDDASVVVRTAAEGASEEELVRDVNRLRAHWEDIEKKVKSGSAPQLLYGEPDLTVRIVRDLFTEDFAELVVQGNGGMADAYDVIEAYVGHVAPHLAKRMKRYEGKNDSDLFADYRLDEQIAKALERKVFLPSGGSLIIEKTEAMTVIDVNTGKFTGSGGNLEATVTSNNLEAAEEIVRQLRLRDIGGIIVIDFIDMVLPSNRELLLRRLVECLGRDRTRHQIAEVTSLGLVQMTRKRIGTGLVEAFSTPCPQCNGRGLELHDVPIETQQQPDGGAREQKGGGRGRGRSRSRGGSSNGTKSNSNGTSDQDSEPKAEQPA